MCGKLYVVATPIGNLADFSFRGVEVLNQVDLIAAEDTRHVRTLLQHYGINKPLFALHQHNEDKSSCGLVEKMCQGQSIALVSDAGTPLLSDPGLPLVRLARRHGIPVSPVPGACALIAALSASGLPVTRFCFEGFLPRTSQARKNLFQAKSSAEGTWAFYESSHRIQATLGDMAEIYPAEHQMTVAREITKLHETIVSDDLATIIELFRSNEHMCKGEFVVIVAGCDKKKEQHELNDQEQRVLCLLLKECSIKTAVSLASEITGQSKKLFYSSALRMQKENSLHGL